MAPASTDTASVLNERVAILDSRLPPACPMLLSSRAAEALTERSVDEPSHCATPRAHSQPSARDGMPTRIISLTYWATMEGLPTPMDTSTPISRRRSFIHSSSTRHSTRAAKMSTPIRVPRIMERTP